MRNKRFLGILLVLLLTAMVMPKAHAYMVHKSQKVANKLIPAWVSCQVHEVADLKEYTEGEKNVTTYEVNSKSSITVENTSNVDAYLRVRLVFHYKDSKGNIVARDIKPPKVEITDDWFALDDYTYCYKNPVAPADSTTNLLRSELVMEPVIVTVEGTDYTYYPVVEIFAEAIQASGVIVRNDQKIPAVEDAWDGVVVNADKTLSKKNSAN